MDAVEGSKLVTVVGRKHGNILTEGLWKLLVEDRGTDQDFSWTGQKPVRAHKVVLDVFLAPDKLLGNSSAGYTDAQHSLDDFRMEDQETAEEGQSGDGNDTGRELDLIVEFLYRGKVSVPEEKLTDLLQLARQLEFKLLVDAVQFVRHSMAAAPGISKLDKTDPATTPGGAVAVSTPVVVKPVAGKRKGRSLKPTVLPLNKVIGMPPKKKPLTARPVAKGSDDSVQVEEGGKPTLTLQKKRRSLAFMKCRCSHCDFETTELDKYRRHLRTLHRLTAQGKPIRVHKCPECPYTSYYGKTLRAHQQYKHRKDKPFRCTAKGCSECFPQKMDLIRHVNEQHSLDNGWVDCDICNRRCSSQAALTIHRETHAGEKPFKCEAPGCTFVSSRKWLLQQHADFAHGLARFLCDTCGKRCISSGNLRRHERVHTKEKPFKCEQDGCQFAFARVETLKLHSTVVHGVGNSRFSCDRCSRRFGSHNALSAHLLKHTSDKPFPCLQCQFVAANQAALAKHLNMVHEQGSPRNACSVCGKRCSSPAALLAHSRTHTQERPFKCDQCSYAANQKWPLEKHMRTMHGPNARPPDNKPRPFSCPHCSSTFTARWSLKQHIDVLHVVGPSRFTCETCDKRCSSRVELIYHNRTHTGERPYSCHLCCYAAIQKRHLNSHMMRMHKIEPETLAT